MRDPEAVICEDLVKRFGPVTAVDGLTFSVEPGEMFGLVGPDGAGKTTTMRILCGLIPPDEGRVVVLGHDVAADPESVKRDLGYVAQQFSLYADLTVAENIRFFADLHNVPKADAAEREGQLLAMTRMAPFRTRLAGDLSGGMKQKLGLMCNLVHRPKIFFLDEPTTGVDPISRRDFFRLLYDLNLEGVTIVFSTPYMDEAERAGRLAFVQQGRIIAIDTPDQFKARLPGPVLELEVEPQREALKFLAARPEVDARLPGDLPKAGAALPRRFGPESPRGSAPFGYPPAGLANPFIKGERLRAVLTSDQVDLDTLRSSLEAAGFRVRLAQLSAPGLDDAFVYLTGVAPKERPADG